MTGCLPTSSFSKYNAVMHADVLLISVKAMCDHGCALNKLTQSFGDTAP